MKNNINNYLSGNSLEIYQNRFMDFFGADDLYKVIEYLIKNPDVYGFTSFNMCYEDKHTFAFSSEIKGLFGLYPSINFDRNNLGVDPTSLFSCSKTFFEESGIS